MKIIFFLISVNLCFIINAQILFSDEVIPYSSSKITDKNKEGIFVAQKIKGKISGTGLLKYKNGNIYIGDFNDKVPHGYGMLICDGQNSIPNCPNAKVYVGKFKDGVKRGKGTCYNVDGEIVYSGKFENDIPIDSIIDYSNHRRYFSDAKTDKFYYLGEYSDSMPDGFGTIFFKNGDILISNFEKGNRTGINIYLESDGNWVSENVKDGISTFISSSREYASYVEGAKSEWKATWKRALGSLEQWAFVLNELSIQLGNISQNMYSDYSENTNAYQENSYPQNSEHSGKSSGNVFDMSEQRAYNQDKSVYSKYDGMLSQVYAGNRDASQNEIKSWKNKMRQLRKKWEAKGKSFPHSANEDK